jgi:hypothetical protein
VPILSLPAGHFASGTAPVPSGKRADNGPLSQVAGQTVLCRRVEIGHCEQVQTGIQGCHNDRPFAGFPAG